MQGDLQINGGRQELYAFGRCGVKLSVPPCFVSLLSAHEVDRIGGCFFNSYTEQEENKQLICQ